MGSPDLLSLQGAKVSVSTYSRGWESKEYFSLSENVPYLLIVNRLYLAPFVEPPYGIPTKDWAPGSRYRKVTPHVRCFGASYKKLKDKEKII